MVSSERKRGTVLDLTHTYSNNVTYGISQHIQAQVPYNLCNMHTMTSIYKKPSSTSTKQIFSGTVHLAQIRHCLSSDVANLS